MYDAMTILGLLAVVVVIILLRRRRQQAKHVKKTGWYTTYLNAVNSLKQNGYEVSEDKRKWNEVSDLVKHDSKTIGLIFVLSDPTPGFLARLVGHFFPSYGEFKRDMTSYASMQKRLKIVQDRRKREGRNFDYYWPEDSLVGGHMLDEGEDKKWLTIFRSAIDDE